MSWLQAAAVAVLSQAPEAAAEQPMATIAAPPAAAESLPTQSAVETGAGANVIAYPPAFFAESRPNTALDMVNRLPGFSLEVVDDDVRGFAGSAGNALVDGRRPASKSDSLADILARIPASQVERIELIRGGAPGIDMQGRSVVVNIVRKRADSFQQAFQADSFVFLDSGNRVPGFRYEANRQSGPRSWEIAVGRSKSLDDSQGSATRIQRDGGGRIVRSETAGTEADGGGLNGKGSFKSPFAGGELRGNASLGNSIFKGETHFRSATDRTSVVEKDESWSSEAGANFDRVLRPGWELETVLLQKLGRSEYVPRFERAPARSVYESRDRTGESIARGLLRHRRSDTLSFEAGGEAAFNFLEGRVAYAENGENIPVPSSDVRVEEQRAEGFVQGTWRPVPTLSIEGGARFESSTISQSGDADLKRSFFYPKPRLLLSWSPAEGRQYRLRIEREVGQLDFGDFVSSADPTTGVVEAGNSELEPDKTWVIEGVAERRFWGGGAAVLSLKHEQITDAVDRVPVVNPVTGDVFDAPGNIGDGRSDEVNLDLTVPFDRLGARGLEFKAAVTYRDSEVTDPTTGEKRRISGLRHDIVELNLRQDLPRYKLAVEAVYFDGWRETYYAFNEVSNYVIRDYWALKFEYKPTPAITANLELNNLSPFTFVRQRRVFDGPRDSNPLVLDEDFRIQSQPNVFIRLRRTFGG